MRWQENIWEINMGEIEIPTVIKGRYRASETPITPNTSMSVVNDARNVLHKHELRLYQLLFSQGLTSPKTNRTKGYPWDVRFNDNLWLVASTEYKGRTISVSGHDTDDIYRKVMQIQIAIKEGKDYLSQRSCCPLAVRQDCVCVESLTCPVHGTSCYGSHD